MKKAADAPSGDGYHHGDLRNALLAAALRLVAQKGAEGFSLREAAREVGVSPAAAYRHFEDKKALMATLAIDGMQRLALAMEEALARVAGSPGSPARAIAEFGAVGLGYVEFGVAHPAHFQVMFGPWCVHADLAELTEVPADVKPLGRDPFQILVDALDGLVRSGAVEPATREGAEISAWASVHGLASLVVSDAMPLGPAERAQALALILRTQLLGMGCAPELLEPARVGLKVDPRPHGGSCGPGALGHGPG